MSEERTVNLVLVGLEEEGDAGRAAFAEGMQKAFGLAPDKVEQVLGNLPFVLSKRCSLDEARTMAEKVQEAGGICRLMDPEDPPEAAAPPKPHEITGEPEDGSIPSEAFGEETPATPDEFKPEVPDPSFSVPEAPAEPEEPPEEQEEESSAPDSGSIPLATPGRGAAPAGKPAGGGPSVTCIECGEVQPPGATCRNCYFPLPEK